MKVRMKSWPFWGLDITKLTRINQVYNKQINQKSTKSNGGDSRSREQFDFFNFAKIQYKNKGYKFGDSLYSDELQ